MGARRQTISHRFVDTMPEELEEGVLYVSIRHRIALHRCFCGCGIEISAPLAPIEWKLIFDGESVSLSPSIGVWGPPVNLTTGSSATGSTGRQSFPPRRSSGFASGSAPSTVGYPARRSKGSARRRHNAGHHPENRLPAARLALKQRTQQCKPRQVGDRPLCIVIDR